MSEKNHRHDQALSMVKIQGIISVIFGSIGIGISILGVVLLAFTPMNIQNHGDAMRTILFIVGILVLFTLPHVYLVVSGTVLMRQPEPRIAKILTIINVVIGVFWNYVLLVFAIISLTQYLDYAEGYHHKHLAKKK